MNRTSSAHPDEGRTTLFQKVFLLLFALLLLVCFEGALKLAGVGGNTRLFLKEKAPDGTEYFVTNNALNKRLFFPVTGSESDFPRPQIPYARFPVEKGENSFRFFVVGASSSVGFPFSPNVAFAGFLREMIAAGNENLHVEAINTSMTAISSYQVRRWVKEIVRHYDPDMVVVYTGHNEVYGVLGAGSSMSVGSNRWMTSLFLKLQSTALYSLAARLMERVAKPPREGPKGQPLESLTRNREIRPHTDLHRTVEDNYRRNLIAMRRTAQKKGVPLFFCTPVSNRAGCSPMVSLHRTGFPDEAEQEWSRHLQFGETRLNAGDFARADEEFGKALAMDSTFAELHYRYGLLRLEEGRADEARAAFSRALLYDALHLRACDPLVQIVREVCESDEGGGTHLVDAVQRFVDESESGVTGTNLVFEHVHPNGRGHYLIASEIYRTLLKTDGGARFAAEGELGFAEASRRTGYTPVDRAYAYNFMRIMLRQWPFPGTYRNQQAARFMDEETRIAHAQLDSIQATVFDAHPPGGTVLHLHHKLGRAYLDAGMPVEAVREFELISRLIPDLVEVRLLLARSLVASQELEKAAASLRRAIALGALDTDMIATAEGLEELRGDPRYSDLFPPTD